MTAAEFNAILDRRLELTRQVLGWKAAEYAKDDRLHNFKMSAALRRCTPAQALLGFWTKHLTSLIDAIEDNQPRPIEWWDEKIGDATNYLILLEGIVTEERTNAERQTSGGHRSGDAAGTGASRPADAGPVPRADNRGRGAGRTV